MDLDEIKQYKPAKLHTGKCWYISFYAYCPHEKRLRIKRIKLNHIEKVSTRRQYANELIKRINRKLDQGWNPFIETEAKKSYKLLFEAIDHYKRIISRKLSDGIFRHETYKSYNSYLNVISEFLTDTDRDKIYVYQFDRALLLEILDYIHITKNNSATTRDNYLIFLRVFSSFLVEHEYIKLKPSEGITSLGKRSKQKKREYIPKDIREQIKRYLLINNKHYLLACEILYYCLIRPGEMNRLQVKHINFEMDLIRIPGEFSKNKKDQYVTVPKVLNSLFIELSINDYPKDYYLFSYEFKPGSKLMEKKRFGYYWRNMRNILNFPDMYTFYSLKDTGITDLMEKLRDPKAVRDQARHHSISMTEMYMPDGMNKANPYIVQNDIEF